MFGNYKFYCVLLANFVIDDCEGHQGITNHLPKGLKCYPKEFSRLAYYKQLQILHLFDTMHIGNNVTETLWKILDGRCDKEKLVKIYNEIDESNHAFKFFLE